MKRLFLYLLVWLVLSGCTVLYMTPGGGVLLVGNPGVSIPSITPTPGQGGVTPIPTATVTPTQIDPTPTLHAGTLEPSPTFTTCELDNFLVRVTATRLNVRQLTSSSTQNPLAQTVRGVVSQGALLEVDACLLETTPPGWFPVHTTSGLQGIVDSRFVDVRLEG